MFSTPPESGSAAGSRDLMVGLQKHVPRAIHSEHESTQTRIVSTCKQAHGENLKNGMK
jgi:hypothetical protein